MGRKHVCNNGEAAHVFASQRAAASAIICLLCFVVKLYSIANNFLSKIGGRF